MTEQNEIVIKGQQNQTQLLARDFASRLRYMIVNGNKLHDSEIYALAQYAAATGLDPFAGECWIIPGKGVCPGIAGWRKKAQDQLDYEAELAHLNGSHFWVEYEIPSQDDCMFDPSKGDIAFVAILRDSVSQSRWRKSIIETTDGFVKMGAKFYDAVELAKQVVGSEPVWTGYGVVFGNENFGGNEKFDRKERAKKRAEKVALRKRFPRIHLPEPSGDDVVDASDYNVVMEQPVQPQMSDQQAKKELGFASDSKADEPAAMQEELDLSPVPIDGEPKMSLEMASTEVNSKGVKYGDLDTKTLSYMYNEFAKKEKTEDHIRKMDAIQTILRARNNA